MQNYAQTPIRDVRMRKRSSDGVILKGMVFPRIKLKL